MSHPDRPSWYDAYISSINAAVGAYTEVWLSLRLPIAVTVLHPALACRADSPPLQRRYTLLQSTVSPPRPAAAKIAAAAALIGLEPHSLPACSCNIVPAGQTTAQPPEYHAGNFRSMQSGSPSTKALAQVHTG